MLANHIVLISFDVNRKLFIQTDGAKSGLGFVIYQTDSDNLTYVISLSSASLNKKQALYSSIEHKSMVIWYTISKT